MAPEPEMHPQISDSGLCPNCDTIVISERGPAWSFYAGNVLQVQHSATAGCRFCTFLKEALDLDLQVEKRGISWAQEAVVALDRPANSQEIELHPQKETSVIDPLVDVSLVMESKNAQSITFDGW